MIDHRSISFYIQSLGHSSTGMKCLPTTKSHLLAGGHVLHDWHAEIVAIRAFDHYLLEEAKTLTYSPSNESPVLRRRTPTEMPPASCHPLFTIREGLTIFMYCSEAPCGDASMELVIEAQEDATPWPVPISHDGTDPQLLGRGSFSQLGVVRRKPCKSYNINSP